MIHIPAASRNNPLAATPWPRVTGSISDEFEFGFGHAVGASADLQFAGARPFVKFRVAVVKKSMMGSRFWGRLQGQRFRLGIHAKKTRTKPLPKWVEIFGARLALRNLLSVWPSSWANYCAAKRQVILSRLQMHRQSETDSKIKLKLEEQNKKGNITQPHRNLEKNPVRANCCSWRHHHRCQRPCFEKVETMQIATTPPTLLRRQHPPTSPTCRPEFKRARPHLSMRSGLTLASNLIFLEVSPIY